MVEKMIVEMLEKEGRLIKDVLCDSWEELVDILADPILKEGLVEPEFVESAKEAVREFGGYMVLLEDIAFFHGKPEVGVNELALTLALLKEPVYVCEKRVRAAFLLAAVDNVSHRGLLKELFMFMDDEECLELLRNAVDADAIMSKFKEVDNSSETIV